MPKLDLFELMGILPKSRKLRVPKMKSDHEILMANSEKTIQKSKRLTEEVKAEREARNRITGSSGTLELPLNVKLQSKMQQLDAETDPGKRMQLKQEIESLYAMIDMLVTEVHLGRPHPNKGKYPNIDKERIKLSRGDGSRRNG